MAIVSTGHFQTPPNQSPQINKRIIQPKATLEQQKLFLWIQCRLVLRVQTTLKGHLVLSRLPKAKLLPDSSLVLSPQCTCIAKYVWEWELTWFQPLSAQWWHCTSSDIARFHYRVLKPHDMCICDMMNSSWFLSLHTYHSFLITRYSPFEHFAQDFLYESKNP